MLCSVLLEVLEFVFSSFWKFCGTVVLLTVLVTPMCCWGVNGKTN